MRFFPPLSAIPLRMATIKKATASAKNTIWKKDIGLSVAEPQE
jgi:hypothetical protein